MKTKLGDGLKVSRIIHGHWRLADWNLSSQELLKLTEQCIEIGITSFDHADIYGNYTCEKLFGDALNLQKDLREKIQIITKCGINLISEKYPERNTKYYDYSYDHIVNSVDNSLSNLNTDYIDLLLLHRPAPFFDPEEVAKAFSYLKLSGKVLHCGVSNFTSVQFEMLNTYTDEELVTNQIEISPYCLDNFENETINFLIKEKIKPMAWSPLAGGMLIKPSNEKSRRIHNTLKEVAKELNVESIDMIVYAWLLSHPAHILPIVGSGKVERLKNAVHALDLKLSLEQWYRIYIASKGSDLP
ncbi:MAG: oxidoreductase [Marinilabiliales bacterium]|nr:MAG: oxidoreductase [Marinilabiliales bacterium]